MSIQKQIDNYIAEQSEQKRSDMNVIHNLVMKVRPDSKLWFLDGKNEEGKIVTNPNIGYGSYNIHYADGSTREFYQVGLSANTKGISVYIMGIEDKNYLPKTYRDRIGKAKFTGYCISFKSLKDIDVAVLEEAVCLRP